MSPLLNPTNRTLSATVVAIASLALIAASCGDGQPEFGAPSADVDPESLTGSLLVETEELTGDQTKWEDVWGADGLLVAMAEDLNDELMLPEDVTIILEANSEEHGPYYAPDEKAMHMPVGFAEDTARDLEATGQYSAEEINELVALNSAFVLIHETGHALIDVMQLPITAREEDSVDALGVVLTSQGDLEETGYGGEKVLASVPSAAAKVFDALAVDHEYEADDFWDEHSLAPQRAATIACLTYGSDPDGLESMRAELQEERADRCPQEFAQVSAGWGTLLAPYLKNSTTE